MQPTNVTLAISGMSCDHCVAAVQSALDQVPGVTGRQVAVGSATLAIDPAAGPREQLLAAAVQAIQDAGYDAEVASTAPDASGAPSGSGARRA